ncbi:hypothetical protein IMCC9480_1023 [Oxalobacteraceae bacterium IMCC9480]|nr:hypothetical protein IMCC9480_1023 [Oxalobacteraceae bacterium IMCC9480]NDP59645.1 M48 family metalloprotease [Oxalobacteraceae bacterium]
MKNLTRWPVLIAALFCLIQPALAASPASVTAAGERGIKVSCGDVHGPEIVQIYVQSATASASTAALERLKVIGCKVTAAAMQDEAGSGKRRLLNQMPFYLVDRTAGGGAEEDQAVFVSDLAGTARHVDVALSAFDKYGDDELTALLSHEMSHAILRHGMWNWLQRWLEILLPCGLLGGAAAWIGWRIGRTRRAVVALGCALIGGVLGYAIAQPLGERSCLRADAARARELEADTYGVHLMTQHLGFSLAQAVAVASGVIQKTATASGQTGCRMEAAVLHPPAAVRLAALAGMVR